MTLFTVNSTPIAASSNLSICGNNNCTEDDSNNKTTDCSTNNTNSNHLKKEKKSKEVNNCNGYCKEKKKCFHSLAPASIAISSMIINPINRQNIANANLMTKSFMVEKKRIDQQDQQQIVEDNTYWLFHIFEYADIDHAILPNSRKRTMWLI